MLHPDESQTYGSQLWLSNKTSTRLNQQIPSIDEAHDLQVLSLTDELLLLAFNGCWGRLFSVPTVRFPSPRPIRTTLIGISGLVRKIDSKLGEGDGHAWRIQLELE